MMPKTGGYIPHDGPFTPQDVDPRRSKEDFIADFLDRRRVPVVPSARGEKLDFEKGDNLILETKFRIHKKQGQVGEQVF